MVWSTEAAYSITMIIFLHRVLIAKNHVYIHFRRMPIISLEYQSLFWIWFICIRKNQFRLFMSWQKSADMFARVAVLLACLHLVAANYRTCKCSIRTGSAANSPVVTWWSQLLHSTCWGCSFPGFHVSCNEVKSWCPGNCYNQANQRYRNIVCTRRRAGARLFVHSQVMSNCGGTRVHYSLCWMYWPRFSRWLGKKCWSKATKEHWLVKSS